MKMSSVYAREICLKNRTRMNKRHIILEIIIIALLIPALLLLSLKLGDRQYYISTVAVMILTMLPFFLHFEYRMPTARELVTLSVMAALCAAGRIAFVMVPHFSAMTGMIMICGIALGPEAGFIIGSVAAFVSNFIYGQGPWTPWQMFAYGLAGLLAALLARRHIMGGEKRVKTAVIGGLMVLVLIGPILDTAALFLSMTELNGKSIAAVYIAGLPVNAIHGGCTFVTIMILLRPILEKLERVKVKYGILDPQENK